jgi:ferredoxin
VKVVIDQEKCVSSGQCVLSTPEIFDQREQDGVVILLEETPPQELADDVRGAAALCPARAILVKE